MNEFSNVLLKKYKQPIEIVLSAIAEIESNVEIAIVNLETIKKALEIKKVSKFSYYDCLIIASSLINNCNTLFTEDLQDNQVIEKNMKIINPFKF